MRFCLIHQYLYSIKAAKYFENQFAVLSFCYDLKNLIYTLVLSRHLLTQFFIALSFICSTAEVCLPRAVFNMRKRPTPQTMLWSFLNSAFTFMRIVPSGRYWIENTAGVTIVLGHQFFSISLIQTAAQWRFRGCSPGPSLATVWRPGSL